MDGRPRQGSGDPRRDSLFLPEGSTRGMRLPSGDLDHHLARDDAADEPEAWLDANRGEEVEGRCAPPDADGEVEGEDEPVDENNFWRSYAFEGPQMWGDGASEECAAPPDDVAASSCGGDDKDDRETTSSAGCQGQGAAGPGEVPRDRLDPRDAVHDDDEDTGPEPPFLPDEAARADGSLLDILMEEIEVLLDEQAGELEAGEDVGWEEREVPADECGGKNDIFADHPGGRYVAGGGIGELAARMRAMFRFLSDRLGGEVTDIFDRVRNLRESAVDVQDYKRALDDIIDRVEDVEALISALDGLTRDDDDLRVTNLAHVRLYLAYCLSLRRSGRCETRAGGDSNGAR